MEQQMVWDLTNNCYQQLPVQQGSPYLPTYHQLYPCPPAEELEDSVALAPTALPLVDLFGGVFMEFVDTLYTSTLVQYVCERTAPSEHRMAAEVLARSNLNPNAKEFNPSQDLDLSKQELETDSVKKSDATELNPEGETLSDERNGREMHSQDGVSLNEEELKEICPNEPEGEGDLVKSSPQIEIHKVPLEAPCDNSACDIAFEENGEEEEIGKGAGGEEEEEDEGRELEEGHCEEIARGNEAVKDPSKEEYGEGVRADDEEIAKADDEVNEESLEADNVNEESAKTDNDVNEESLEADDDEESEDWWDSDEEPCTPSQEIDPSEFEDLFCCPLSLNSLHPTKQTTPSISSSTSSSCSSSSTSGSSSPPPPSSFTSVATISLAAAAPTKADTRLEIVNRAFNEKYSAAGAGANGAKRKVHFSEEATWQVIEEPEELAEDLCEARCSDLEQRRADRERQERLLGPVLTPVHRRRMYLKIYGDEVRQHQEDFEKSQHQGDFEESQHQEDFEERQHQL